MSLYNILDFTIPKLDFLFITFKVLISLEMEGSLHDGHDLVLDGGHILRTHELDDVSLDCKKTG